jgi:hypothetical protein
MSNSPREMGTLYLLSVVKCSHTSHHHQLTPMLFIKAILALAAQYVGADLGDVLK